MSKPAERSQTTRRSFLSQTALLLSQSSLLMALQRTQAEFQEGGHSGPAGTEAPGFSLQERDLRWGSIRQMLVAGRLDGLLCAGIGDAGSDTRGQAQSETRYVSQIGAESWTVFPTEGEPAAVVSPGDEDWRQRQRWISDVRLAPAQRWGEVISDILQEKGLARSRLGLSRLVPTARRYLMQARFTSSNLQHPNVVILDEIRRQCPKARWEMVADEMMRLKLIKSLEEQAVLRQVTAIGEEAIGVMLKVARPGVLQEQLWEQLRTMMTEATGEEPARLAIRGGDEANTSGGEARSETFQAGQIINQEIAASKWGYMAQVNHSVCVGAPAPEDWEAAAHYCIDLIDEMIDWIRPGRRFRDLCYFYARRAADREESVSLSRGARRRRFRPLNEQYLGVLVHTCGFGDGPRMGITRMTETIDLVIQPGMAFTLKPRIVAQDVRPAVQFGVPVVVTEQGAERLGTRPLEVLTLT